MKYTKTGFEKPFNVPDNAIDEIMEKHSDLSIMDACEMWLIDNNVIVDETVEKLTKKAEKNRITQTIHGAKGEKKPRKPKEKKEKKKKKDIIQVIYDAIADSFHEKDYLVIKNDEKYIDFSQDGREFTINLVEHRKKKS